ncbi:MAG: efflux transporter outer membrane subunit [Lautropia sp.]
MSVRRWIECDRARRLALAAGVVLALAGCASSEGIETRARPIAPASVGLGSGADVSAEPGFEPDWWSRFGDASLTGLIERALAGNPGLKGAQARVARADALAALAGAASGPQVDASADATRQRYSENGVAPPPLGGSVRTVANAQIGASWTLDFFGRNAAAIEAAVGARRAAQAEAQATRIALAVDVARTWIRLARLVAQREVATRTLAQREEILDLIRRRVRGGLDTTVELRQGEGALPESRQRIEELDEQIVLARHALAALAGRAPGAVGALAPRLESIRALDVPASIPAGLIGRRADITAARWQVEAAGSEVEGARAQFYPNIDLKAFAGLASLGLDRFVEAGSRQWGVGPAIRLPIFDAGRLRANLGVRTADLDAAIERYNGAVVDAVRQAADQLSSLKSLEVQRVEQARAQSAAESAWSLAKQRYRAGLASYLVVLNAEATLLNQRRLAVDLQARTLDAQIALIGALGGGFRGETPGIAGSTNLSQSGVAQ